MASRRARLGIRIVFDFDSTITKADTTAVIGTSILEKCSRPSVTMSQLTADYMADSRRVQQELDASATPTREPSNIDDLVKKLSAPGEVEVASLMRFRDAVRHDELLPSRLLESDRELVNHMSGEGKDALRQGRVEIRESEVLKALIERAGDQWGIVSVSWSRGFIWGVLQQAGIMNASDDSAAIRQRIRCNEALAPTIATENLICTAKDKRVALKPLLKGWEAAEKTYEQQPLVIYIGDSTTDIGCLAGVGAFGIYLNEDESERRSIVQTLSQVGVDCKPVSDLPPPSVLLQTLRQEERPIVVGLSRTLRDIETWLSQGP